MGILLPCIDDGTMVKPTILLRIWCLPFGREVCQVFLELGKMVHLRDCWEMSILAGPKRVHLRISDYNTKY